MELEEGDIVLCTVDRIVGTTVFVKLEDKEIEGSIVFSEVAPGRIRNIRDYVVPKKKIVCKVLRISGDRVDLSLRRVTQKEQKELFQENQQEKSYSSILKNILKDKTDSVIKEIKKETTIYNFLEEAKNSSKELEKIVGKTDSEKILEILNSQKQKKSVIKKEISLNSKDQNGIQLIKDILLEVKSKNENIEIKYVSAGKYLIKAESNDMKATDKIIKNILVEIEEKAKKQKMTFEAKEK